MSLSVTRSRRSNAGNRWAEALAAAQLENGDAPDPDAEISGEEFVGKDEEDVFESDFESTDEEEYAKQGVEDGEKEALMEERAERRAARVKASKSAAAPLQKIIDRAIKGEPAPKKRKVALKTPGGYELTTKKTGGKFAWDATRQSERASTVKHKTLVQERLKVAERRKAHAPKRLRQVAPPKTQDELIAAALELEEKNTKLLKEFLVKEEEKRAAARRVVRMRIEGPLVRWVSRGEDVRVKVVSEGAGSGGAAAVNGYAPPASTWPSISQSQVPLPPAHTVISSQPLAATQAPVAPSASIQAQPQSQPQKTSTILPLAPAPTSGVPVRLPSIPIVAEKSNTPAPGRRSSTPAAGQRRQVYVEVPTGAMRRSASASSSASQASPKVPTSQALAVPPSQPLTRSPLSSAQPLPRSPLSTSLPLTPSLAQSLVASSSQPMSRSTSSLEPAVHNPIFLPNAPQPPTSFDPLRRPSAIRQASVGSTSSNKSRMVMYVELPMRRKSEALAFAHNDGGATPQSGSFGGAGENTAGLVENSVGAGAPTSRVTGSSRAPDELAMAPDSLTDPDLFPPGGPNFAIVLPLRKPTHKTEKQMRNYVVVELGERVRASFGKSTRAVFGDHADWEDVLVNGVKPIAPVKPICAITGLDARYRDRRTGIPYANAYAYKTLTRLLAHEFVWSKEKGCYVGDEGRNPARGVPPNWNHAATGPF